MKHIDSRRGGRECSSRRADYRRRRFAESSARRAIIGAKESSLAERRRLPKRSADGVTEFANQLKLAALAVVGASLILPVPRASARDDAWPTVMTEREVSGVRL